MKKNVIDGGLDRKLKYFWYCLKKSFKNAIRIVKSLEMHFGGGDKKKVMQEAELFKKGFAETELLKKPNDEYQI